MPSPQLTRCATGACAVATAVAVLTSAPASYADSTGGTAFGIAATGPVQIGPLPSAVSTPEDRTARHSLLRPAANSVLDAGVLNTVAAPDRARSSVADLSIAKAVTASAVTASCVNGKGRADLAGLMLAGRKIESAPAPNTTIPVTVDGLGTVSATLNRQVRRSDGRLAVTALVVRLPLDQTIEVANATCRATRKGSRHAPEAPVPSPVEHDLVVTG